MARLVDQLERLLSEHGWEITSRDSDLDWWMDEQWVLTSSWSPIGKSAYISFLVDPMSTNQRKKGEAVWAVSASAQQLEKGVVDEDAIEVSFKEKNLRCFVESLNQFR